MADPVEGQVSSPWRQKSARHVKWQVWTSKSKSTGNKLEGFSSVLLAYNKKRIVPTKDLEIYRKNFSTSVITTLLARFDIRLKFNNLGSGDSNEWEQPTVVDIVDDNTRRKLTLVWLFTFRSVANFWMKGVTTNEPKPMLYGAFCKCSSWLPRTEKRSIPQSSSSCLL